MTDATRRSMREKAKAFPWYLVRRWLYWLFVAALGVLVYYGVIEPEALGVWLPLILAALNTRPPATPDESEGEG